MFVLLFCICQRVRPTLDFNSIQQLYVVERFGQVIVSAHFHSFPEITSFCLCSQENERNPGSFFFLPVPWSRTEMITVLSVVKELMLMANVRILSNDEIKIIVFKEI